MYVDASLDQSGWRPWGLAQLLHLLTHHPVEEASELATRFGLTISGSELDRLSKPYVQICQTTVQTTLTSSSQDQQHYQESLSQAQHPRSGGMMVLQTDGVMVLKRPEDGRCEGMEIKSAVLYPQHAPLDSVMLAEGCSATEFLPMLAGLTKCFCTPNDVLVGLGDGASWVEEKTSWIHWQIFVLLMSFTVANILIP